MHDTLVSLAARPLPTQTLLLAAAAGVLLGAAFFVGLWLTTCRATASARPAIVIFTSLFIRMGLTLGGFYLVADGQWERLLACLLGFVLARLATIRLLRPAAEGRHAP
jgi:F1F0 ATPase subunit 2